MELAKGTSYSDILKVEVVDQIGKAWPVSWPNAKSIKKTTTSEILDSQEMIEDGVKYKYLGFRAGCKYYASVTKPTGQGGSKSRFFNSFRKDDYKKDYLELMNTSKDSIFK